MKLSTVVLAIGMALALIIPAHGGDQQTVPTSPAAT